MSGKLDFTELPAEPCHPGTGIRRLDSSRNASSDRCDITAKNLADFAELRKEHVMVAALDLAVAILIQSAFCR